MRILVLLPVLAVSLLAQPSATMRPALFESFDVEVSSSSNETLKGGTTPYGSVSVLSMSLSASGRHKLESGTLVYGLAYRRHSLDATTALLPGQLAELSFNVGLLHRFSNTWSSAVFARPGFYGDFADLSASSLNVPVLAMLNYTRGPTLTWNFGLNLNAFSDNPILPVAGVRWQFAPDWVFTIGFPQSGFSWRASESLKLRAGVGFAGGSFRITENRGVSAPGAARLANTFLDFREVRAGLGADLNLGGNALVVVDLGAVTDRKFDYFDRGFQLDGDAGLYGTVAIRTSF